MAKKFDGSILFKWMEEEKAAREEREAKAKIDWRKKLKLMPWQTLKDVELPDEFYESLLIKIRNLDTLTSYFKTISDIIALSIDYEQYSEDWVLAMKYMYLKFQLPDGKISPLLPAVVSSMIDIATKDAREKKLKTMKEWRETMESLTEKMLPQDENKLEMNSEILLLKLRISELEGKLREAENLDKRRILEIDRWHAESEAMDNEAGDWHAKYDAASDALLKTEHERDVYKKLLESKPDAWKFTVRQTAIIAFALCRKGVFIPNNKKSISAMFQNMTGRSANTLGTNLCSTYTDEEIEEIAAAVEKDMPEFASYLREKTFFLPDMKK